MEEDPPVPLVTHANVIQHSISSNVEVFIDNQHVNNSNGFYAHKSYLSNKFKTAKFGKREFCTAKSATKKNFLMKLWKGFCLNHCEQGKIKGFVDPMVSCCMVNWMLTSSPLLNWYLQIWKLGFE